MTSMMGIHEHDDLDEFFDMVGQNSSCHDTNVVVCHRMLYEEPCGSLILISENPKIACTECEVCGRLAILCRGCSFSREADTCVDYEPACRFRQKE